MQDWLVCFLPPHSVFLLSESAQAVMEVKTHPLCLYATFSNSEWKERYHRDTTFKQPQKSDTEVDSVLLFSLESLALCCSAQTEKERFTKLSFSKIPSSFSFYFSLNILNTLCQLLHLYLLSVVSCYFYFSLVDLIQTVLKANHVYKSRRILETANSPLNHPPTFK